MGGKAGNDGSSRALGFLRGVAIPATAVAVWQLLSMLGYVNPLILPAPSAVLVRWYQYLAPMEPYDPAKMSYAAWVFSGELIHDAYASLYRVVVGFLIGAGLALPLGLAMGANEKVYKFFDPLLQVLRPIPPIAYIPLAILWFGLGNPPAIFLITLGAFFPVLMNTISGVREVDVAERRRRILPPNSGSVEVDGRLEAISGHRKRLANFFRTGSVDLRAVRRTPYPFT